MREWKPGDVAVADGGGIFMRNDKDQWIDWRGDRFYIKSPRPLVVIDPEDREQVERLLRTYHAQYPMSWPSDTDEEHARNLQAALREFANPTPPKPDEPTGLGAVVEDEDGALWISVTNKGADDRWQPNNLRSDLCRRNFRDIAAVRVLSEGVQP